MRLQTIRRLVSTTGRRQRFIERYEFPVSLGDKLADAYEPQLDPNREVPLVLEGLRSWYLACLFAKGKVLGMPSRAVDAAWHEMILMTREYHVFCTIAFGRYLHHTPEPAMSVPMGNALARTLHVVERHPVPGSPPPAGIPLLFAVDSMVGIDEGIEWTTEHLAVLRQANPTAVGSGSTRPARCSGRVDWASGGEDDSDGGDGCGGGCGGD